jgi:hypothetical protein
MYMVELGNAVIQWISAVGFPIVMCLILIKYLQSIEQTYQEELKELRKSIDANTITLTKLAERLFKNG